ncbi:MAG TPA: tetratricopeptide repeat protein [Thermoanaerobaculia bacterium]|nr:tetratricopeptide repeat protein [Thermoanaerobaculia bacterium]
MPLPRPSLLLVTLLFALEIAAVELPRATDKWFEVRADDIRIFSNVSPAAAQDLAREVLRMRAVIGQITNLRVRTPVTTRIFHFANQTAFAPYRDAAFPDQPRAKSINGAFLSGEGQNIILLRADGTHIERPVYHELIHYFVKNTVPKIPLWINEGLADFFSTFRTSKEGVDTGIPIPEHVAWLRQGDLLPLRELFAVDAKSPHYNERRRSGVFYAQSWGLVHYLMLGNEKRRPQFLDFVRRTNAGETTESAFAASFGIKIAQLDREFRDYAPLKTIRVGRHQAVEIKIAEPPPAAPMPHDVLLYELGQLISSLDYSLIPNAQKFFEAALKENPRNSAAWAYLGRVHAHHGRNTESEEAFARAIEIGTDDSDVYVLLGRAILERANQKTVIPQAEVLQARALLAKAVELQPDSVLALLGHGVTYLYGDADPEPGIDDLQRAAALAPDNELAQRTLGLLRARQFERAINAAIQRFNLGRYAEAVAQLDRLIPMITIPKMKEDAQKLRDDMAKQLKR